MQRYKSLAADNQFKFVCPIFGAEVALRECMSLQNSQYRGQAPAVRKGCQACISASKCPTIAILRELRKGDDDPYYSETPKVGRLSDYVMRTIAPIVVPESTMKHSAYADMLPRQAELIRECNGLSGFKKFKGVEVGATLEDIGYKMPSDYTPAKGKRIGRSAIEGHQAAEPTVEAPSAAVTGDLSAALNKAIGDNK